MKTAVKVLSILGIILVGVGLLVMIILTLNIKTLIDYSYEQGTLYYNGHAASASDVELMKGIFASVFLIVDIVLAASAALPIINLVTADSDNKTLHLVLGILDILFGVFIVVGIVQILIYAGVDEAVEKKQASIQQ